jgi:ATP-dependent Clp protease ATP-binding subunit ClpA
VKVSAEVEIACSLAQSEASRRRHDMITVEHLLYALLHDDATARVVRGAGGNVDRLKKELDRLLESELNKVPGTEAVTPAPSRGFQRVLQRAAIHVQSSGKEELKGYNILVAI